jgi:RHS repeat-associated protein
MNSRNLLTMLDAQGSQPLAYSYVPNATINHVEWDYDPYGRKIARTEYDGAGAVLSQTRYVYDGWQLVQEIDALTDTVLAEYVYGPGYIDDVIQSSRGGNTYYHHTDQQYSTVAITDVDGNVVERYGYYAFGNAAFYEGDGTPLTTGSDINNPILYTGRTWQPELGLYDFRNRQYDPTTGRFTTPDPIGAHGDWNNLGNAYTYVGNNPGRYQDPLGLWGWDADWVQTGLEIMGFGAFSNRGRSALNSFWVKSGGSQLRAMGSGLGALFSRDALAAGDQMLSDIAGGYENRIMMHYSVNGGNIEGAIASASGIGMIGSDIIGLTELDEARVGLDYSSGYNLSGTDRVQRALIGASKIAGTAFLFGSRTPRVTATTTRTGVANASISTVGRGYGGHAVVDRIAIEAQGAFSQANRVISSGGTGATRWGQVYQTLRGSGGATESLARRQALHSIASNKMKSNHYVLSAQSAGYSVEFNRGGLLGARNIRGNLLRPDIQIRTPSGRFGVIDWTTPGSTNKILKYGTSTDVSWMINVTMP